MDSIKEVMDGTLKALWFRDLVLKTILWNDDDVAIRKRYYVLVCNVWTQFMEEKKNGNVSK